MAEPEITSIILREIRDELRAHTKRFDQVDQRLDKVDQRLDKVDQRLDKVEARLDTVERRLDHLVTDVGGIRHELAIVGRAVLRVSNPVQSAIERHDTEIAELRERVAKLESKN